MNNVWNQMVLFNQLTLRNILNRQKDLGTPKMRAAVASLTSEQRDNAICFLKCSTEGLAGLPDGQGIQAKVNVRTLLDYLPIIEPNMGGNPDRVAHKSLYGVASSLLLSLKNFLVKSRMALSS